MKKPLILATIITPPRIAYFEGEGDGGDNGDGGTGDGGDPNASILDFKAPDIDLTGDVLTGKKEGDITTPPPVAKPEPKAKAPAPAPKAPVPPKEPVGDGVNPPVKQLRDELATVKKERDELKLYREKGDPKLAEVEAAVKAKETEIAEAKERLADYERRLAMGDPEVTKKLREFDGAYEKDASKFYTRVPELQTSQVHALVGEYDKLPFGKPGFREAHAEFEAKVNEALGAAEGMEHRKLTQALEFIERTHEAAVERPKLLAELNGSALQMKQKFDIERHGKEVSTVKAHIEEAAKIPEGIEKTDPFHPKVTLKAFMDTLPEADQAKFTKDIPEFIERVMGGPKPRTEADYAGMTPDQVKQSKAAEAEKHQFDRKIAVDVMFNGLKALRILPALVKDWQRMRERLKGELEGAAPDPTGGAEGGDSGAGDDIKTFKAPNLDTVNI